MNFLPTLPLVRRELTVSASSLAYAQEDAELAPSMN